MTRFLSEALQATEPFFHLGLQKLEAANGHPKTDIRFSTEIKRETANKLRQLGLDPMDTTGEELYHALKERMKVDDERLIKALRTKAALYVSAEGDVQAGMLHVLKDLPDSKRCFALKASALKSLLKQQPPKKAIKKLGYRSLDSFLKHETAVSMLTAAWLTESRQWQHRFLDQYKRLQASDFENRQISITQPAFKRWPNLADDIVAKHRHNVLSFKELGVVVLLPFPAHIPAGAVTASLTLALRELNEIRAGSTFLKLNQVRTDFGQLVRTVASGEPELRSDLLDQPMPWNLIQRYYARLRHHFREAVFGPHIQIEDMAWHPIEQTLAHIEPSFTFWQHSSHLGLLQSRRPVSCNIVDVALNYCNQLPFNRRVTRYFQHSLWHELLLRYLQHESVERTVMAELQPAMAIESIGT